MKYRIITEDCVFDLQREVNKALGDGWSLQGGVCVIHNGTAYSFYQALFR